MQPLFTITGIVEQGKKRGKQLGFPTANIALTQSLPSGIYISIVAIENIQHPALTFIGDAKTFSETLFQSETYLLDFSQNLYGKPLTIFLLKKIRENQAFTSVDALVTHMKEDEKQARKYFQKIDFNEALT